MSTETCSRSELSHGREDITDCVSELLVGDSAVMRGLRERIRRIAPTRVPVLLQGPTGCGKEMVAQALHGGSGRTGAYIPVNMAALTDGTAESELFGHVRGAFTGAHTDGSGLFAAAHGGTLLLDEINSCSLAIQGKVLRAVERQEVRQVGAQQTRTFNFRVIAASNVDLATLVDRGEFRRDLLHRLGGVVITISPLSEHPDDIPALVARFSRDFSDQGAPAVRFESSAFEVLRQYDWPGNVRELRHVVEGIALLHERDVIHGLDVQRFLAQERIGRNTVSIDTSGRAELLTLLQHHQWDVNRLAATLGVDRSTLYRRMKKLGVTRLRADHQRRMIPNEAGADDLHWGTGHIPQQYDPR